MNTTIIKKIGASVATLALMIGVSGGTAFAQGNTGTQFFTSVISPMNNSNARGFARLAMNGDQLNVRLFASGMEANQQHLQHIHGKLDGSNAVCPLPTADTDNDGTVSLIEGNPFYGPILESLTPFPTTSTEVYNQTFTVNTSDPAKNVLPLERREIVLHGMTVAAGQDMFNNNGAAGYDVTLPIACGHINPTGGSGIGLGQGVNLGLGTSIGILGNGAGSHNSVNVSSSNSTRVSQNNNLSIENDVNSTVNTGSNHVRGNTGGFTGINSGSASSATSIINRGNTNMLSH